MSPSGATPVELKAQIEAERRGAPFLVYRDGDGRQEIRELEGDDRRLTVGRGAGTDVRLHWDEEVSRVHTELEHIGAAWTVVDDGLSRNGTFLNGARVTGRRRLRDGDVLRIGATTLTFRAPAAAADAGETVVATDTQAAAKLSDAQRRVLVALCRPFRDESAFATPPTNQAIADELFLSVDAVKTHLRALFAKFEVEGLPQNQKRQELARRALHSGAVTRREL